MKPAGNSQTIVSYGNATGPTIGSMPMIDNRVGLGGMTLQAPGFTAPKMPLIERVTPRTVNASKGIDTAQSRVAQITNSTAKSAINIARGFVRSVTMQQRKLPRFTQRISTAYWVK